MITKHQRFKARRLINEYYDSINSDDSDGTNELIAIKDFLETLLNAATVKKSILDYEEKLLNAFNSIARGEK